MGLALSLLSGRSASSHARTSVLGSRGGYSSVKGPAPPLNDSSHLIKHPFRTLYHGIIREEVFRENLQKRIVSSPHSIVQGNSADLVDHLSLCCVAVVRTIELHLPLASSRRAAVFRVLYGRSTK